MSGVPKAFRPLAKIAKEAGWTITSTKSHTAWESPEGEVIVVPGTVNDKGRKVQNHRGYLRRAGLDC